MVVEFPRVTRHGSRIRVLANVHPCEVAVLQTPRTIELVADRIEQAYQRRRPQSLSHIGDTRVWTMAAQALLEAHRQTPWLPLDPELFVAAQTLRTRAGDPWSDLAPRPAMVRYRRRILYIVQSLRRELRTEVRRVEGLVRRGRSTESILGTSHRWLSPLGAFIAAYKLDRLDLMEGLRPGARDQHDACPLYRIACRTFLPTSAYPVIELLPGLSLTPRIGPPWPELCLN